MQQNNPLDPDQPAESCVIQILPKNHDLNQESFKESTRFGDSSQTIRLTVKI